ncbi:MAG TPA: DUF3102 domain-containing protein [Blastocatellia bacterium]|nr:DUF3102 domain-containing protein [Blastocatellia bacterium]
MSEDITSRNSSDFAAREAEEIRLLLGKTAECVIEVGRRLIAVKAGLKHGEWGDYLRREFDWSERNAQRFMNVAEYFKNDNLSGLNIAPSALYLLAAPGTPERARDALVTRARQGERITHSLARDFIESSRPVILVIDPEFASLLPRLRPEVWAGLEASILQYGCVESLVTWRGVLLDGHARYAICHQHGLPFKVVEIDLADRNAAKLWILRHQLSRKNFTPDEMVTILVLAEEMKREEAANQ